MTQQSGRQELTEKLSSDLYTYTHLFLHTHTKNTCTHSTQIHISTHTKASIYTDTHIDRFMHIQTHTYTHKIYTDIHTQANAHEKLIEFKKSFKKR